ncbi:V-type ATP synthase subunit D [Actinomadura sp. NPDC048032]|uniref:V-type ATP synthase subunit D n=1 Tax=Actinomadura sp. NPDC048032 TaxID=3155747 RepID=UPI0034090AD2
MSTGPRGRAGRLWHRRRIAAAEAAIDLLERKLGILRDEQDGLHRLARATGEDWERRCREADRLLNRATLLGGRRVLPLASTGDRAELTVEHTVLMGVTYPRRIVFDLPDRLAPSPSGTAVAPARRACRAALEAACAHAAATAAAAAVDAEVAATRQRVRAIERRRLPRLRAALTEIEAALEEREREDGARLRLLAGREGRPDGRP